MSEKTSSLNTQKTQNQLKVFLVLCYKGIQCPPDYHKINYALAELCMFLRIFKNFFVFYLFLNLGLIPAACCVKNLELKTKCARILEHAQKCIISAAFLTWQILKPQKLIFLMALKILQIFLGLKSVAESEKFRDKYPIACCRDSEILGNFFILLTQSSQTSRQKAVFLLETLSNNH